MNNQINIKTERDIETQLGIKVEKNRTGIKNTHQESHSTSMPMSTTSNVQTEFSPNEKKKLIEKILALKSENQTLVQKLNEKDAASKKKFETKVSELTSKLAESKAELSNATRSNAKSVSDLKRENLLLTAQNKQLKTGIQQAQNDQGSDDDLYEVEALLNHKEVHETHYFVQWKGFDQTHNSWERESNLFCRSVLKKYKKLNKIK